MKKLLLSVAILTSLTASAQIRQQQFPITISCGKDAIVPQKIGTLDIDTAEATYIVLYVRDNSRTDSPSCTIQYQIYSAYNKMVRGGIGSYTLTGSIPRCYAPFTCYFENAEQILGLTHKQ